MNPAAEVIVAIFVPEDQGFILILHQFFNKRQIADLFRSQAILFEESRKNSVRVQDVAVLIGPI